MTGGLDLDLELLQLIESEISSTRDSERICAS